MIEELVQLPFQSAAGIRRRQGLAEPEMIGAVQGGQYAIRAVDPLEVGKVVLGSQVHAPALVRPLIRLGPVEEDHGFLERRAELEHRAVFLRKVRKDSRDVAVAKM